MLVIDRLIIIQTDAFVSLARKGHVEAIVLLKYLIIQNKVRGISSSVMNRLLLRIKFFDNEQVAKFRDFEP